MLGVKDETRVPAANGPFFKKPPRSKMLSAYNIHFSVPNHIPLKKLKH